MKDVIVYCSDAAAFDQELIDGEFVDENGNPVFAANRTPRSYSSDKKKWVTLVRLVSKEKAIFAGAEILGTKEEVDAHASLTAKYLECYNRTPYSITDPITGEEIVITPPYWHGAFA